MGKEKGDPFISHIEELYHEYKTYDYYRLLGMQHNVSVEEIKRAFFNTELKYHPDMYHMIDEDIENKLLEIFTHMKNAYMILTDPIKRSEYDLSMKENKELEGVPSDIRPRMSEVQDDVRQNEAKTGSPAPGMGSQDNSNKAKLRFRDGKVAFWDNDFSKAARLFEMAKEVDCSVAEYHYMHGCALGKLGKNKEAMQALNRAKELKPFDPDTLAELGHLCLKLGFPLRADGYFKQAISIDPSNKRAREGKKIIGHRSSR